MKLGDLIRDSDIFEILHTEDCRIIVGARNILKQAPLNSFLAGDNVDKIWFDSNIKSQEELLQLKTRVDCILNKVQLKISEIEGESVVNGEFSYIKTREERFNTMLASDSVIKDQKESLDNLKIISSYIDGLLWSLRDLMKLFKR